MAAARAAGLWAIGVVPPYVDAASHEALLYERGAHTVIHNLKDLPALIDNFAEVVAPEPVVEE